MEAIEMVCKFILLVLYTQLGKTFTTITRIQKELDDDEELGRSIHMVFTMNTLLNNRQFAKRLEKIERDYGKGSIVIFASVNTTAYTGVKTLKELKGICMDSATCPKVIVMCSNDYRYEDGLLFIETLEKNRTNFERVFAYYDELHKYISPALRQRIEDINNMKIVKGIVAMTATPLRIWEKTGFWSNIRMIQLDNFNDVNYAGYKNMIWNCIDTYFPVEYKRPNLFDFDAHDANTLGFINHVLNKHPDILSSNTRTFIPAHIRRVGHNSVRDLVFERNPTAVVVVLNGAEKTLTFKDLTGFKKTIDLGSISDEEVCQTIADRMIDQKLINRALVITGFLCVGMGQTLTHRSLGSFTSAIISHLDQTNDEVYQLFGRVTGRMLDWGEKYVQTQIYCPTKIMHRCHVMEECARRIALDYNDKEVTKDEYLAPMNLMGDAGESAKENIRHVKEVKAKRAKRPQPIEHNVAFNTVADVNTFLSNTFKKPVNIKAFHRPMVNDTKQSDYQLSTRLNAYYKKKMGELVEEDRLVYEWYKKITMGMNISSEEGKGQQYMVYPVYPTKESPPSDVKYYVRYIKPTE